MNKNNIKLVIFDMDGTLADTSPGILNCHKYANVSMGRIEPTDEDLAGIIGGPLLKTYIERFKFSEDDAKKAVENYRARYAKKGVFEAVATLKAEVFAKQMLQNMGVADLFDVIHGVDMKDSITKSGLINLCLNELNVEKENTVLVGDSIHDFLGARESNVGFVAAMYGFGFKTEEEKEMIKNCLSIQTSKGLIDVLSLLK